MGSRVAPQGKSADDDVAPLRIRRTPAIGGAVAPKVGAAGPDDGDGGTAEQGRIAGQVEERRAVGADVAETGREVGVPVGQGGDAVRGLPLQHGGGLLPRDPGARDRLEDLLELPAVDVEYFGSAVAQALQAQQLCGR